MSEVSSNQTVRYSTEIKVGKKNVMNLSVIKVGWFKILAERENFRKSSWNLSVWILKKLLRIKKNIKNKMS